MIVKIPFRAWTGKAALEIEVSASVEAKFHLRAAVETAVKGGADLRGADLRGADLSGAVLRGADLRGADPRDADLSGADLRGAVLRDADLRGADLSGAVLRDADLRGAVLSGADLRGAVLSGADLRGADLRGAVLSGAVLSEILETVPLIPNIDAAILDAIEKNKAAKTNGFDMASWHGKPCDETNWCNTTHCRAGYAICLAGKEGFALEEKYGPANAGMFLYLKSTPNEPIPYWGASNEAAMADMKARAERQLAAPEAKS